MNLGRNVATSLVVVFGMAAAGSYLHAQPAPAPTTEPPTVAPRVLTPEEMQAEAAGMVARMDGQVQRGVQVKANARNAVDVIKLTCVNQKLAEARALTNIGDNALTALVQAIKTGNQADQSKHYQQVAQASADVTQATQDLEACLGVDDLDDQGANQVQRPKIANDPTRDCNNLGRAGCLQQPLESVAWASPFTPN